MMLRHFIFAILANLALCCATAAIVPVNILTPTHASKPKYYEENGVVKGLCIAVLRAIEKIEPSVKFVGWDKQIPLSRIEEGIVDGAYDLMICNIKTPERSAKMVLLDLPIFSVDDVLIVRGDDTVKVKSLEDVKKMGANNAILVWFGTNHAKYLAGQTGLAVDAGAYSVEQLFNKLQAKRGRFIFLNKATALNYITQHHLEKEFTVLPDTIRTEGRYFYFSKKVAPAVVAKVKASLEKMERSGMLKNIADHYTLE